jgi:hypothetical protein
MSLGGPDGGYGDIDPELRGEIRRVAVGGEDRRREGDAGETNRWPCVGVGEGCEG